MNSLARKEGGINLKKVFITLSAEDQVKLDQIRADKDPQKALDFLVKVIAAKIDKQQKSRMAHNVISLD